MATLQCYGGGNGIPNTANLGAAQTGNGQTTNVVDRSGGPLGAPNGPALVKITTTVGATPTCTYLIEGSVDGTNWFPVANADSATPATVVGATFAITSATTVYRLVQANQPWRYLRVTMSANTNVTNTIDIWVF